MLKRKIRFLAVLVLVSAVSFLSVVSAKTWRLEETGQWQVVSSESQDKYLLAVVRIKQLVNAEQCQAVQEALNKLKKDFPEAAGPDLDGFIEAEMLFCEGKFAKAVRSYDKFLAEYPESDLYQAALDRQFSIATAFLAGQKKTVLGIFKIRGYAEGEKIMERISDHLGDAPMAIKAAISIAKSYEKRNKFNEAYHKWSQIFSQWPMGQTGKDALLGMARCKYAAYRGPKYSVSALISAKSYYENFKLRYPKNAEEIGIDKILEQIDEQLADKQLSIGQYYQRTGNKQSANFYYQMVVDDWPDSSAAKKAKGMID